MTQQPSQNLSQPRHHPCLLEKGWNLPWQTKICSGSVKITEKKLSYRKNITAQAPKEASSIVMEEWRRNSSSFPPGRAPSKLEKTPWTQQGRMCGTSQGQLGSTEQAKLK